MEETKRLRDEVSKYRAALEQFVKLTREFHNNKHDSSKRKQVFEYCEEIATELLKLPSRQEAKEKEKANKAAEKLRRKEEEKLLKAVKQQKFSGSYRDDDSDRNNSRNIAKGGKRINPFLDISSFSPMYKHLPPIKLAPLISKECVFSLSAPPESIPSVLVPLEAPPTSEQAAPLTVAYKSWAAGRSVSTYPHIPGNPLRDGTPICDYFSIRCFQNRVIVCVADGCGWGEKPRAAAIAATNGFMNYIEEHLDEISNVKEAGTLLLQAFSNAHEEIMVGKEDYWEAGTTTLLGGILMEIDRGLDKWTPPWEFVCASVGDCKAFSVSSEEIVDITASNRMNVTDAKDCGGRLGPQLDNGAPDLRNLNIFAASCEEGDMIFIASDGIHDNFDPQHLGIAPKAMPKYLNLGEDLEDKSWEDVPPEKAEKAKELFVKKLLLQKLANADSPETVITTLINHSLTVTRPSQQYMEENQGKRVPDDYSKYPGKMDHATCVCIRVGRTPMEENNDKIDSWQTRKTHSGFFGDIEDRGKRNSNENLQITLGKSRTNSQTERMHDSSSPPSSPRTKRATPTEHALLLQEDD